MSEQEPYTPSIDEVREAYVVGVDPEVTARYRAEFDRWLAAHDAEVAAKATAAERERCARIAEQTPNVIQKFSDIAAARIREGQD